MQVQSVPQQPAKAALRSGATLGIALGIIHSVITIILTRIVNSEPNTGGYVSLVTALYLLTPLIWIVGLLAAGVWGGQSTGKISTGTLAGLFAGLFGGIIAGFGQVIATTLATNQPGTASGNAGLLLFAGFAAIFYVLALAIGAGAGLGALGGLIGQSISSVRPQPHGQQPATPSPYAYIPPQQMPQPQQSEAPQQFGTPKLPEQ